jgi:hypothetical protein
MVGVESRRSRTARAIRLPDGLNTKAQRHKDERRKKEEEEESDQDHLPDLLPPLLSSSSFVPSCLCVQTVWQSNGTRVS